ncbi:MAG: hypothetical protein WAK60_06160 [Sedimentisphaerales bacterium]
MQNKVSISLCASVGGIIAASLTAAVIHTIWGLGPYGLGEAGMLLSIIALLVFQISGFAAGISERGTASGRIGLALSIVLITAAAGGFILFIRPHLNLGILIPIFLPVPTILMGLFAGVTAIRLQRQPSLKIWKALLILWITPSVWYTVLMSISAIYGIFKGGYDYKWLSQQGAGVLLILFGPWATIAAKLSNWPNAGEFFSLPAAVIFDGIVSRCSRCRSEEP